MTDRELLSVHVRTLFTHDERGRMLCVNEPSGRAAPRFWFGRCAEGNAWRYRIDLSNEIVASLEALAMCEPHGQELLRLPPDSTGFEQVLAADAPVTRKWSGPAYRFPLELPAATGVVAIDASNRDLLRPHLTDWLDDVPRSQPFVAHVRNGHAVSLCCSGRRTEAAHEAAVETGEAFRGCGYAAQAVAAWARAVHVLGAIPLYSTSWENAASRALAAKLGLICYGTDLHFT